MELILLLGNPFRDYETLVINKSTSKQLA